MIDDMEQFIKNARNKITVGKEFNNPGGGISRVTSFDAEGNITYQRKKSPIRITIQVIICTYNNFCGRKCSSNDLKQFAPRIYDSKSGHACNCTFFFLVLKELNLVDSIQGEGKRNSPFYVIIRK